MKQYGIRLLLFFLVFAAFGYGLIRLFYLRFEAGDIYPPYSSLRSDPLGVRAFYESLNIIDHVRVERNFNPLYRVSLDEMSVLIIAGDSIQMLTANHFWDSIGKLASEGARIIIAFKPSPSEKQKIKKSDPLKALRFSKKLGVAYSYARKITHAKMRHGVYGPDMPKTIPWHSSAHFSDLSPLWQVLYELNDSPVVIERKFGRGDIVLMSDAYLLSNEAMMKDRFPSLLSWIIGNRKKIVFDESHFGIHKSQGIVMLARKYGLHGFFFGLLLPVVFFIWKNTMPLVPPRKTENHQQHDEYKTKNDTLQGLVHLLRRGITKQQILNNCVKEWEKSGHREIGTDITARIRQIARQGGVIRGNTVDPVAGYNLIGKLISQRKS